MTGIERAARLLDAAAPQLNGVLRALAVWHGPAPVGLVRTLASAPPALSDKDIVDGLHRSGLVGSESAGAGMVGPLDPAAAELVLTAISGTERARLRRGAAELAHGAGLPLPVVGRLLLHAAPVGQPWALAALTAAAAQARRTRSHPLAADLLRRALLETADPACQAGTMTQLGATELVSAPLAGVRRLTAVLRQPGPSLAAHHAAAADLLICAGDNGAPPAIAAAYHGHAGDADRSRLLGLYWLANDHRPVPPELADPIMPPIPDPPQGPGQCGTLAWFHAWRGQHRSLACRLAHAAMIGHAGDGVVSPRLAAARALLLADDEEATTHTDALVAEARHRGTQALLAATLTTRAELLVQHGRLDAAAADLDEAATALPQSSWQPAALARLVAVRTVLAIESGQLDQAERSAGTAVPGSAVHSTAWTQLLYARGVWEVTAGRHRDAVVHLRDCGRRLSAHGGLNPALAAWRSWAATAYLALGQPAVAAELVDDEIALAEVWGAPTPIGTAHLRAGLLHEGDQALPRLRAAAAVLRTAPARQRHIEALVALASAALAGGDPGTASAALDEADQLTADSRPSVTAPITELRQRLASRAAATGIPLSAAQRRVASLAADGLTNTEISGQLSITRRAVELHLSNAYRRLGIRGRTELAAALRRSGT